jgi:PAS domain S-box-containing protein
MPTELETLNQLRNTLRKMELALGAVEDGIVWMSADGRVQWCNRTFDRLVDRPHDEVLGNRLTQVLPLERGGQPVPAGDHPARTALKAERLAPEIYQLPQVGRILEVEVSASRVRMDENDLSVALVVRDITEQRRAELRRREAEERYRLLLENIPAILYMDAVDENSSNLFTSPYIEELMGYTVDEWVNDKDLWPRLIYPDDRERVLTEHARTNVTGDPFRMDYRMTTRDGRVLWVHDEAVMLRAPDGRAMYWLGVITDITKKQEG